MSKFIAGIVVASIPSVIGIIGTIAAPAVASPACMTQEEARKAFPRDHIYWHGLQHCWDNIGKPRSQPPAADTNPTGSLPKPSAVNAPRELPDNRPGEAVASGPGATIIVPPVQFISDNLRRELSWPALDVRAGDISTYAQQDDPLPVALSRAPKEDVVIGAPNAAPGSPEYLLEHCCWPPSVPDAAHQDNLLRPMVIASTSACALAIGLWLFIYRRRQPARRHAAVRVRRPGISEVLRRIHDV